MFFNYGVLPRLIRHHMLKRGFRHLGIKVNVVLQWHLHVICCGFDRRSMTMLGANIGITKHYRLCLTRCRIGSSPAQHSVSQWELKCNGLLPPCQRDTRNSFNSQHWFANRIRWDRTIGRRLTTISL